MDAGGNAYVAGITASGGFPDGRAPCRPSKSGVVDAFVTSSTRPARRSSTRPIVGGDGADAGQRRRRGRAGQRLLRRAHGVRLHPAVPRAAGARAGHPVYKSTDAAANWGASDAGLTATAVSALAADPSNANVVYAGTSGGVFKSTDGGANWTLTGQARPGTAPPNTLSVAVDPNNPNVVYAATGGNGVLYKSADGGTLYDIKSSGINAPIVNAVIAVPTAPGVTHALRRHHDQRRRQEHEQRRDVGDR